MSMRICIAATALLALPTCAIAAPGTWQQDASGQWRQIDRATTPSASQPEPALDAIEQLIEKRRYRQAEDKAIEWLVSPANQSSSQRDRALFLVARAEFAYGNRIKAFYYLDELLDTYPESHLFFRALELQYQIADEYLNGYRRRFAGIAMFHADEEAIEMLYRIQSRTPGSSLAERALLRTADYYYAESDFDFASDAYAAFLRQYPRSPHVPHVRLRRAYASLAQFNGLTFDATSVIDGREQLRAIVALYPELAAEKHVPALLKRIDVVLAQKLLVRADFYRRTRRPQASAYMLKYLLKAYAGSAEAAQAESDLRKLPLWAQRKPGPQTIGEDLNTMDDPLAPLNPASPQRPTQEQALPPVPGSRGRSY